MTVSEHKHHEVRDDHVGDGCVCIYLKIKNIYMSIRLHRTEKLQVLIEKKSKTYEISFFDGSIYNWINCMCSTGDTVV